MQVTRALHLERQILPKAMSLDTTTKKRDILVFSDEETAQILPRAISLNSTTKKRDILKFNESNAENNAPSKKFKSSVEFEDAIVEPHDWCPSDEFLHEVGRNAINLIRSLPNRSYYRKYFVSEQSKNVNTLEFAQSTHLTTQYVARCNQSRK